MGDKIRIVLRIGSLVYGGSLLAPGMMTIQRPRIWWGQQSADFEAWESENLRLTWRVIFSIEEWRGLSGLNWEVSTVNKQTICSDRRVPESQSLRNEDRAGKSRDVSEGWFPSCVQRVLTMDSSLGRTPQDRAMCWMKAPQQAVMARSR